MVKDRAVYIYNFHREGKGGVCVNRPLTYVHFQGARACYHVVRAGSRAESFKLALAQHNTCDQSDSYCDRCRSQGKEK